MLISKLFEAKQKFKRPIYFAGLRITAQELLLWNKDFGVIERLYSNYEQRQSIHKDSIKNIHLGLISKLYVGLCHGVFS